LSKSSKPYSQAHVDRIRRFRHYPLEWVKAYFGDNIRKLQTSRGIVCKTCTGLSIQQEEALVLWGKLIRAKEYLSLKKPMTDELKELSSKIGMSIQSANGTGKDFMAGLITWHFLTTCHFPKVMATSNTDSQLKDVFWSELSKIRSLGVKPEPDNPESRNDFQSLFEMQSESLFALLPDKEDRGKRWFCRPVTVSAKSTQEEKAEAFSGRHEDFMLILIDEASGKKIDALQSPIERTLTGKVNLCFMIFNPTRNSGWAVDTQKDGAPWVQLHWSALESENVSPKQIEILSKGGLDTDTYRIGVLGLPPLSNSQALIPYEWLLDAEERELEVDPNDPVIFGCDVGGGGDKSVICIRRGGIVDRFLTNNSKDTMVLADWIAENMDFEDAAVAHIDIIGLGGGVYDRLRQMKYCVRPFDSRNSAERPDKFFNKRAEKYFELRDMFENKCIKIPAHESFKREAEVIKSDPENKNKINDKKEIRKELRGFSPDHVDALVISLNRPDSLFRKRKGSKSRRKIDLTGVYLR